jgi:extracellular factor (EF) 3-hydroxypalmitic acid methyl ester biosynthesis protein
MFAQIAVPESLTAKLDRAYRSFARGETEVAWYTLREALGSARAAGPAAWKGAGYLHVRDHPIFDLLLESPLARRCFEKPSGYAGDAETLDLIHGIARPDDCTLAGWKVFSCELELRYAASIRARRVRIARYLNTVRSRSGVSLLSIGCGHFREADAELLARFAGDARIVGVDRDQRSLDSVRARFPLDRRVELASVHSAHNAAEWPQGTFDAIVATTLTDFLSDAHVAEAVNAAAHRLAPGGTAVFGFSSDRCLEDVAYVESVMDYWPSCRDERAILALTRGVPASGCAASVYSDRSANSAYLCLRAPERRARTSASSAADAPTITATTSSVNSARPSPLSGAI